MTNEEIDRIKYLICCPMCDNEYTELAVCDECKERIADKLMEVMNNDKL